MFKHINTKSVQSTGVALGLSSVASLALAHDGHLHSLADTASTGMALLSGLIHPVTGPDHLLMLLCAGLSLKAGTAFRQGGMYVLAMLLGALVASAGWVVPGLEWVLAATVLAGGLLLLIHPQSIRGHANGLLAVGGSVALACHGAAHGLEAPAVGFNAFMAGMLLASGGLLAVGVKAREWLQRSAMPHWNHWVSAAVSASGLLMLVTR